MSASGSLKLRSHEVADWHYYTEITDNIFYPHREYNGTAEKEPDEELTLSTHDKLLHRKSRFRARKWCVIQ